MQRTREFIIELGDLGLDRLRVRFTTERKDVVRFVVQYEALIGGRWHQVVRHDTTHHEAHAHFFHPDGTSDRMVLEFQTYAEAFTHAYRDLKARWRWYRMGYEQELEESRP